MSERNIGLEILEGIKEVKAYKAGKISLKTRELKEPESAQVMRKKLNLSQSAFAGLNWGVIIWSHPAFGRPFRQRDESGSEV